MADVQRVQAGSRNRILLQWTTLAHPIFTSENALQNKNVPLIATCLSLSLSINRVQNRAKNTHAHTRTMNYYIILIAARYILFHTSFSFSLSHSRFFSSIVRSGWKKELQIVAYRLATRTFAQRNQQERLGRRGGERLDLTTGGRDRNEMTRLSAARLSDNQF